LKQKFLAASQPEAAPLNQLYVIIRETNRAETQGRHDRNPDVEPREPRPQQCRDDHGADNQQPAHGRRIAFGDMRLWPLFADLLPDVPFLEPPDQFPAKQKRDQHRRHRGVRRPKGDVLKNVQRLYEIPILILESGEDQFVKDVIEHLSVVSGLGSVVSNND
jgi:hypothetical protein